jgi:uncharacterized protein
MHVSKYVMYQDLDTNHALIASSLTGAIDLLDSTSKADWVALTAGNKCDGLDKKFMAGLRERGYIYDSADEEAHLFSELATTFRASQFNYPLRFAICPTYQCNLACQYCYEGRLPQVSTLTLRETDVAALFRSVDLISSLRGGEKAGTELTGGEPLLPKNKSLIEQIFLEASKRGHSIGVVSNGVCLASHFAQLFRRYSEFISFVQVTLDGPQQIHDSRRPFRGGQGTFEAIATTIDFLLEHELPVRLRVNIDAQNMPYLSDLAGLMQSRGWVGRSSFQCHLSPVLDHRGDKGYPYLLPEIDLLQASERLGWPDSGRDGIFQSHLFRVLQHISSVIEGRSGFPSPCFQYCEANSPNFFVFGADGFIYPCGEAIGNPELAIGRFLPAHELWPEKEQLWRTRSIATIPECRECSIAGFCGGGCTFSAFAQHGSPNVGMCGQAHEVLRYYCQRLGKDLCKP